MNRIEYMTKLASLLQDIPEVERRDAMKYYNDYLMRPAKRMKNRLSGNLALRRKWQRI